LANEQIFSAHSLLLFTRRQECFRRFNCRDNRRAISVAGLLLNWTKCNRFDLSKAMNSAILKKRKRKFDKAVPFFKPETLKEQRT